MKDEECRMVVDTLASSGTEHVYSLGGLEITCAGFGGQGILALGEILAIAGMRAGRNVSWLPSYGPESRGGTCNCDVILADGEIASPVVDPPDVAVLFNQPSLEKFESRVLHDGLVLYDSGLGKLAATREGIRYLGLSFTTMAVELGTERVANMVALGAYVAATGSLTVEEAVEAMREKFAGKEAFFELNERAIAAGVEGVDASDE